MLKIYFYQISQRRQPQEPAHQQLILSILREHGREIRVIRSIFSFLCLILIHNRYDVGKNV